MENTTYSSISKELPRKNDFKALSNFFEGVDTDKWLEDKERRFYREYGAKNAHYAAAKTNMLAHELDAARTRWACISAESQRAKKSKDGIRYICKVYDNLTTIRPDYERAGGLLPPDESPDFIYKFSKRSRQRLMSRAKRLNKQKLPFPYFVTLTYHKNFQDPERAKQHLNTWLQRWRRKSEDVEYFWKMEPQSRGAVHFHICMFIPEPLQRLFRIRHRRHLAGNKHFKNTCLDALKVEIGNSWAEVTADVDGVDVPFTKFDYMRHSKRNPAGSIKPETYRAAGVESIVATRCRNPRTEYKMEPDIEHRLYGTNVRTVENWTMFLGYIYKYMKKEIADHPFGRAAFPGTIQKRSQSVGFYRPPYMQTIPEIEQPRKKTGRFWGFSYGLDFQALSVGIVDHKELENVNDFCNALNALSFARLVEHLVENAKRQKKKLADKPKKLERKLKRMRRTFESQKKRYLMQKNKVLDGYGLQFDIGNDVAMKAEKYLRSKSVGEFFDFP